MKVKLTKPRLNFSILFIFFFTYVSAQDTNNERPINPSSISLEKNDKIDVYNYKYENTLISIFKEEEGIQDIYQVEKDCPRINQKINFREAEIQFINDVNIWITEKKAKYPKAFIVITSELNN